MSVALALGGGAGLGWAHIGVLRALDDAGITVGAMAGTSIGGVAAIAYAAGRLDTLEDLAHSVSSKRQLLPYLGLNLRTGSMLNGRGVARLIETHLGDLTFESLAIPTVVVAADLLQGAPVILGEGPVGEALRATIALPGIFSPEVNDGQILIDGGAVMPVPVVPVRAMAPGLPVVAVNLQGDYAHRRAACGIVDEGPPRLTTLGILRASAGLMLSQLARYQLDTAPPDLELSLPIGHIETANFTRAAELIEIGREAVAAALPRIEALAAQ